jgi:voltage-gated potassium channel
MAAIMTGIVASAFTNQVARKKAAFEAQLREVFSDGNMSEEELATLKRLQAHYRLTDEQVEAMLQRAQSKSSIQGGQS